MEELMVGIGFIVVTWGIYAIFELFVHRKERLSLIEKLDSGNWGKVVNPDLDIFPKKEKRNSALRIGLLLMGIGFGMLVGYFIFLASAECILQLSETPHSPWSYSRDIKSIILGSCMLLFGGAALLMAYLIERKHK